METWIYHFDPINNHSFSALEKFKETGIKDNNFIRTLHNTFITRRISMENAMSEVVHFNGCNQGANVKVPHMVY